MSAIMAWEGTAYPPLVDFPLELQGVAGQQLVRCVCIVEHAPHVPEPAAIGMYALGVIGAALAAYGAGRLARIRSRRYP